MPFVPDSGTESSGFVADKPGVFSRVGSSLQRRGQNMARMFNTFRQSQSTGLRGFAEAASTGVGIVGQVAGGVGDVLAEGVIEAGKAVLNEDQEREIAEFTAGIMQSKPVQSAVEKWGAFEKEHPFASAAVSGAGNIVGLVGTGGVGKAGTSALRSAAGSAVRATGRGIMSVAEKVAPKTAGVLKTGMNIAREVSEGIGSQLTQLSPETIKSIVAGRVSKQAVESLDRASLASRAREGIKSAFDDVSGLGDEYGDLRASGATANIPGVQLGKRATNVGITEAAGKMIPKPFTDAMSKFGLLIDPETGRITRSINSRPFQPKTIRALQDVLDTYGKTGALDANEFLNVRNAIDNVVDWNSPDADISDALTKAIRANYNEIGRREIPGLANLDDRFAPMIDELGTLRRQFLTGKGELKDTAYTTLANLTNKGREQVLARLEKYVPGITQEIKVLRAVEDIASASGIKVGTYARGIIIGGAGLSGGAQGAILAFIATHPSVVVPLLRKYGELRRGLQPVIDNILRKMNKAEPLDPPEREVFLDAITASREFQAANKTDIGGFGGGRKMTSSFRPMDASDRYAANLSDMGGIKKKDVSANSSLIAEAKKYKTADSFVKAQELYTHQTNRKFDDFDVKFAHKDDPATWFYKGKGEPNPNYPIVMERYPNRNIKLIAEDRLDDFMEKSPDDLPFYDYLSSKGFDGIDYGDAVQIFNTQKSLKTKSQLLDIYKKAHGGTPQSFERAKDLSKADQQVESRAFNIIENKEDDLLRQYESDFGNIVNTDNFRRYFRDAGYNGSNAAAVQEPSSYLAKKAFTNGLQNPEPNAVLFAGGSGTGKTSAANQIPEVQSLIDDAAVVLDGNLSSYSSASKRIKEALDAGKKPPVVYVYRNAIDAFENGVVKRMLRNKDEGGRLVPTKVIAANHIGSFETVRKLYEDGIDVYVIDNSLGAKMAKLVPFEQIMKKVKYPSVDELTTLFNKRVKELFEDGTISKEQYEAYIK